MDKIKLGIVNEPVIVAGRINEGVTLIDVKFGEATFYGKKEEALVLTFSKADGKEKDLLAELEGGEAERGVDKTFSIQRPNIFHYDEVQKKMIETTKADADTLYNRYNNLRTKTLNSILSAHLSGQELNEVWKFENFYAKFIDVETSKEKGNEFAVELKTKLKKFIYDKPDEFFKHLASRFVEVLKEKISVEKTVIRLRVLNNNGYPELPKEAICERNFLLDLQGNIIDNPVSTLYWTPAEIKKNQNRDDITPSAPKTDEDKVSSKKKKEEDSEYDSLFGS